MNRSAKKRGNRGGFSLVVSAVTKPYSFECHMENQFETHAVQYLDTTIISVFYACMVITSSKQSSMGQSGMVANPARGQLHRENNVYPFPVRA